MLARDDDTEEMADTIQRFVGIATPVVRIALRGARFTRVPWVLVASSTVSLSVTVRAGVRELQVLAAFLTYRFETETGSLPDPAVLRKLTLELYLSPRKTPNVSDPGYRSYGSRGAGSSAACSVGTREARPQRRSTRRSASTSRHTSRGRHSRPASPSVPLLDRHRASSRSSFAMRARTASTSSSTHPRSSNSRRFSGASDSCQYSCESRASISRLISSDVRFSTDTLVA